jgi:hypothetical protein
MVVDAADERGLRIIRIDPRIHPPTKIIKIISVDRLSGG